MVGMLSLPLPITGTKLALVSPFKDADQWDKAMFGLDLSAEKQFKNGISIFFKANNLLDAKRERYLKTVNKSNLEYEGQKSDKTIVGTYQYGRTFLLGVVQALVQMFIKVKKYTRKKRTNEKDKYFCCFADDGSSCNVLYILRER